MNKNGESYSSAIQSRRKRPWYKWLLQAQKVELIHALEAEILVEQKRNIFDEPIPNDPTPVLQPTPWRSSNITTNKRLKIFLIGCRITYHQNQRWLMKRSNRLRI